MCPASATSGWPRCASRCGCEVRSVLAAVDGHPRHVLLFAVTAGLLTGPLAPAAMLAAAVVAAVLMAAARAVAQSPPAFDPADSVAGSPIGPRSMLGLAAAASPLPYVAAAAVLAGAGVADLRLGALEGGPLPHMLGRTISGHAVLLEPVRERKIGPAVVRARFLGGPADGEVAVLRVRSGGGRPGVGEIVAVRGEVAPLGRFDDYQRRRGANAAVEVTSMRRTGARRGGVAGIVDGARRRAEAGLARGLPEPEAALLRGMVLGQDERLADDVRDEFERSGLAHVLAVSGQNVMLLATLVLAAGSVLGLPLRTRLLVALALVAFYVPLTGAGPSIQRAGVMGAAGLVAALAGRPAHRWYALGLAAAVTLALNPRAVGEPGWQLSFAAVAALLALAPALRGALARRMPDPVADVAAITIAATVGTAPLMALHFEQVSLAALPANLLAAAAIAPVMWLGMLGAAAAQIAPALALPFNAVNAPLLAFVEWVAHTFAAAPGAVVPLRIGSPAALAGAYALLAAAIVGVRRIRWPEPIGRGRRTVAVLVAAPVVTLASAAALGAGSLPPPAPGEFVVSFLDVGQGDATLLQKDGVAVLVDTGPPDGPILRRLSEAGVERLDALVITHAQSDHEGAALEVLRRVPTRLVVNGGAGWPTRVQDGLATATRARRVAAHAGQSLLARRDPHAAAVAAAARPRLPARGRPQRPRGRRPRAGRRLRPAAARRRRVRGHRRARAARGRGAQGRAPRQRRRGPAGPARAHPPGVRRHRGRSRQHLRPPGAVDPVGPARRRPRLPHRPRRHRPAARTRRCRTRRQHDAPDVRRVPTFKPAYLIHGDDHGRIGERRAKLRAMAEAESGQSGVELFEGDACTAEAISGALTAMTFALGRRFVIADGVERWKDAGVAAVAAAMEGMDTETLTVAFFAREDARVKVPAALQKAVEKIGGVVAAENVLKSRALPGWLVKSAADLGFELDQQGARALVAQVGDRQQRLLRELEKLALEYGEGARVGVEEVEASCASSAERKAWSLADALVAGDGKAATRLLLELREQGDRLPSLLYQMVRRVRDALAIAEALAAGQPPGQIRRTLRMPSYAADRMIADVANRDVESYRRAMELLADLEVESRGGGGGALSEDTAAVRAVIAAAA